MFWWYWSYVCSPDICLLCFYFVICFWSHAYPQPYAVGHQVGANANDDRAEEAIRLSQRSNPALDIAFRRGGEAMEGSGGPPGVSVGVGGASAAGPRTAAVAGLQPSD